MILIPIILAFVILANIGLGITVFLTNTKRKANQAYLFASAVLLSWLISNLIIFYAVARRSDLTILAINAATAISTCTPSSFQLLRLAIKHPSKSWLGLLRRCALQILLNIVIIFICFMPSFTKSVEFPAPDATTELAHPVYGPLFILYALYFVGSICFLGYNLFVDRKHLQGAQRLESEFLVFACLSGLCIGAVGILFVLIYKSSSVMPITNAAGAFTILLIVAYGITFYKILTVSALLRIATAYTLLTAYLCAIYYVSWLVLERLGSLIGVPAIHTSHLLATIIVVFSIPHAKQRLEKATERLFRSSNSFNMQATMKRAGEIFQSVTTINALLHHFSNLLTDAIGANKVVILTLRESCFTQTYPMGSVPDMIVYAIDDPIVKMLSITHEPASIDSLHRRKQTPLVAGTAKCLSESAVSVATGIFSKSGLTGIVLIGPRKKGRIYDKIELEALQILCNQLAVAFENSELYTEVQDSKIRNEIMLDQLVSGVIVANPERKISLFNHEAQRITGIEASAAIGKDISDLPKPIANALETTLSDTAGKRNVEARLYEQDETRKSLHIRMGTTYLHGHDQKPMGALLVFTDMTELKTLEEQVRRSDQLSSVGTLAAGMAHEIKNPLVTIKTFTQLLPERYADDDFRKDFSSLVAHEVSRIDGIVNELLSFSKPTKPHLIPMNLQDVIGQMLKLTHEQMAQKNIVVHDTLIASKNFILGDAKLLSQALINLTLNAIDAIGSDGMITVGTTNCKYRFANSEGPHYSITKECIRLQISDSGQGIAPEHIKKIFDPFFTCKSEGTGMGLSVAHGIIQEHHAVIEVESEIGKGSTFYVYIPVIEEAVA